jgi:glycosyltransferase involved in cell wall biosynthesis
LPHEPLRVLVSGMVAGVPGQGGATWAVLQWVLGLRRLGHDVLLVEPVDRLSPERVAALDHLAEAFDLKGRVALVAPDRATAGPGYDDLAAFARSADAALDVAGMLRDPELLGPVPVRAYVDLDPGFTQVWHAQGEDMGFDGHTHFVTVGLDVGEGDCLVPKCDRAWIATLPPVVLDEWPEGGDGEGDAWTTVANWRGYGSVDHAGRRFGQKCHSWRALLDLPGRTGSRLEPAVAIHPGEEKDLAALDEYGWRLADPGRVAGTPQDYRAFVRGSRGELGVAKEGYVTSLSGWFSDRSACYLAAGRPVVAQDTGWTAHLPHGHGLLAFTTAEEAAAALDQVDAAYDHHRRAARRLAEEHLDSDLVIGRLLDRLCPPGPGGSPFTRLAARAVPRGETVLVASKGDGELLRVGAARGAHFPQGADGAYLGHHPATGADAVAHLELLRSRGARFLAFPEWAMWWLDHYGDLRAHLEERCAVVGYEAGAGIVYALRLDGAADRPRVVVRPPPERPPEAAPTEPADLELTYKRAVAAAFPVDDGSAYLVTGEIVGTETPSTRAALLCAEFVDGEGAVIPGPYRHFAKSPREELGWYVYLPTRGSSGSSPFACLVEPPEGAVTLRARLLKCDRKLPDRLFLAGPPGIRTTSADDLAAWSAEVPDDALRLRLLARLQVAEGRLTAHVGTLERIAARTGLPADEARHRTMAGTLRELGTGWSPTVPGRSRPAPSGPAPRICHLFKVSCPFESSGGAVRNLNTVRSQKAAGLDPYVVTPLGYPASHGVDGVADEEEVDGVLHVRLPVPGADDPALPVDRRLRYDALLTAGVIRTKGADVIHAASGFRGYELALKGLALARHFAVPLVYEVRSLHEHLWGAPRLAGKLEREWTRLRIAQENRCMAEADVVVTLADAMRDVLVERGVPQEKIVVVPNAVDEARFRPEPPPAGLRASLGLDGSVVVGYISNVSYREGHDVLVRAFAEAARDLPDLRCLLVGDGPERAAVERLAERLGVRERLVTTGEVDHRDIVRYYSLIDVFVVPRRSDYASDFVTPLKPFEAMALERPMVVADLPSLREIVGGHGERGVLFRPETPSHLAARIRDLARHRDHRLALGAAGRAWVLAGRTWAGNARRYVDLYGDLLGRNGVAR